MFLQRGTRNPQRKNETGTRQRQKLFHLDKGPTNQASEKGLLLERKEEDGDSTLPRQGLDHDWHNLIGLGSTLVVKDS